MRKIKPSIKRNTKKVILIFLTIFITISLSGIFALDMALKGPSQSFSDLLIATLNETRRGKYILNLFFTKEEVDQIEYKNSVSNNDEVTYTNDEGFIIPEEEKDDIEIIDIHGSTYTGKLMIVRDPSRIQLAWLGDIDETLSNRYYLEDYVKALGGIGGLNAGGFDDPNGKGDGTVPYGIVVKDGQLVYGDPDFYDVVIGFNDKYQLCIGTMTGQQAIEWGFKNAVSFKPALIINGEPATITGTGGGLNPRSAIAQTWDGSILLLAIDGRQTTSLGANYSDVIKILLEYGAVNAANLDGGSSTVMYYNGEIINSVVSMNGDRSIPTAWVVK